MTPRRLLSERVVTTMSYIGQCDDKAMHEAVKAHSKHVATTCQDNKASGRVHRWGEKNADGKKKNEDNTRTLVSTNLRWDRAGAIKKRFRERPYVNKVNKIKSNFNNAMECVTDGGITSKLFSNGRIQGAGYKSETEFKDFNNFLIEGLFPGCKMKTVECCLVHSHAQMTVGGRSIDMSKLMDTLGRCLPSGAIVQERVRQGCILLQFPVEGAGGPTISVFPEGKVQVVAKSYKDDERMWQCVRSFVVPKCLTCL